MAKKLRILHLTLRRDPFKNILAERKKTEYRDPKLYWKRRLEGREFDVVVFRNGYSSTSPEMAVEYRGLRLPKASRYRKYEIKLGRILSKKRIPRSMKER